MKNPIRYLLVGAGSIGRRHAAEIRRTGVLVGVCDLIESRAQALVGDDPVTVFTQLPEMLARQEADILVICTPNGLHVEQSRLALEAGLDVLCEKPLAISLESAQSLQAVLSSSGRRLWIVKQNRFNPPVAYVKQLMNQQALGIIHAFQVTGAWQRPPSYYQNSWHGSRQLDGGTLYTQFSHFIDLLCWWLGPHKKVWDAQIRLVQPRADMEIEDLGMAHIEMQQGALGNLFYTVNAYNQNMEGSITLYGEKGTLKVGGAYLNELSYHQVEGHTAPTLSQSLHPNQYAGYTGSMSNHPALYDTLVEEWQTGQALLPSWQEGLDAIALIDEIYQKAGRL